MNFYLELRCIWQFYWYRWICIFSGSFWVTIWRMVRWSKKQWDDKALHAIWWQQLYLLWRMAIPDRYQREIFPWTSSITGASFHAGLWLVATRKWASCRKLGFRRYSTCFVAVGIWPFTILAGLGLELVNEIVEINYGGIKVFVSSQMKFTFYMPIS